MIKNYSNERRISRYVPCPADTGSVVLGPCCERLASILAERFHEDWYRSRLEEGATLEQYPELKPYSEPSDEQRDPSLRQATETVRLIAGRVDLEAILDGRSSARIDGFADIIARNAHEVWARNKMDNGWKYGPVRDNDAKIHPMLVPYDMLPDSEKEYDLKVGRQFEECVKDFPSYNITFSSREEMRANRDGIIDVLYGAYPVASRTSEVIKGKFAEDFAGTARWTRAIDFDVRGMDEFKGLRFIDFKDCTNIYVLFKDGESKTPWDLTTVQLKAVRDGLMDHVQKLKEKNKRQKGQQL